ncbi:hypothetical protein D9619_001632 [Psilocybe cf. subviscida]|uniref:HAD phosphatase n=1 Tax=Psilocybe cf. subviscida TaxID=2480587 RepID=A0A8H5BEW8_9AGAR|nr:hypothetical protein D9619_001632 [Psilocybe cf. subviscida]
MPLNVPGILVPFHLFINPRLVIPALVVKDIRHIDFSALKRAGYRGAVFDKDNCLTVPYKDTLVPELQEAWKTCRETFGEDNVLIVSNSAGTYLDAGGIQSESVTHHLGVPVLRHKEFKPAYSCIAAIRTYFSSLPRPVPDSELIVVGDRIFTDVVIANRMKGQNTARPQHSRRFPIRHTGQEVEEQRPELTVTTTGTEKAQGSREVTIAQGPLAIWTTGVWERESMVMRWLERKLVDAVENWSTPPTEGTLDTSVFTKHYIEPEPHKKPTVMESILASLRRT